MKKMDLDVKKQTDSNELVKCIDQFLDPKCRPKEKFVKGRQLFKGSENQVFKLTAKSGSDVFVIHDGDPLILNVGNATSTLYKKLKISWGSSCLLPFTFNAYWVTYHAAIEYTKSRTSWDDSIFKHQDRDPTSLSYIVNLNKEHDSNNFSLSPVGFKFGIVKKVDFVISTTISLGNSTEKVENYPVHLHVYLRRDDRTGANKLFGRKKEVFLDFYPRKDIQSALTLSPKKEVPMITVQNPKFLFDFPSTMYPIGEVSDYSTTHSTAHTEKEEGDCFDASALLNFSSSDEEGPSGNGKANRQGKSDRDLTPPRVVSYRPPQGNKHRPEHVLDQYPALPSAPSSNQEIMLRQPVTSGVAMLPRTTGTKREVEKMDEDDSLEKSPKRQKIDNSAKDSSPRDDEPQKVKKGFGVLDEKFRDQSSIQVPRRMPSNSSVSLLSNIPPPNYGIPTDFGVISTPQRRDNALLRLPSDLLVQQQNSVQVSQHQPFGSLIGRQTGRQHVPQPPVRSNEVGDDAQAQASWKRIRIFR